MVAKRKAVWVSEELWEQLMKLKIEMRARSLEEVIAHFLDRAVGPSETVHVGETGKSSSSRKRSDEHSSVSVSAEPNPQSGGSHVASDADEDQSSQPASRPAGTDANSPPRKHRWAFCPKCLNMYDFQGKCPSCGVDLISLDTEENKKLYIKLKGERGWK
jgi:hypothetical protein